MPKGFTARFAARLNELVPLRVIEAADRMVLERGTASHAHETRETTRQLSVAVADTQSPRPNNKRAPGSQPRVHERQLQAAENEDRATIRVDAPDEGRAEVIAKHGVADDVHVHRELVF